MKKHMMKSLACLVVALACVFMFAGSVQAVSGTIYDTGSNAFYGGIKYYRASPTATPVQVLDTTDVIGGDTYSIDRMVIDYTGTILTVTLYGGYATHYWDNPPLVPFAKAGDLYISTSGWRASGTAPNYEDDTFTQDEGWDFVISREKIMTGIEGIYKLSFAQDDNDTITNIDYTPTGTWTTYREGQAYRWGFDPNPINKLGSSFADAVNGTLFFTFDVSPIIKNGAINSNPMTWGYHWTMSCGNDVVEGVPVPEPASLLLLGIGLFGLGALRKRSE